MYVGIKIEMFLMAGQVLPSYESSPGWSTLVPHNEARKKSLMKQAS